MEIEICKWYNNALSPVIFMIDDLANVWVDVNNNGVCDPGEDWGYAKRGENSSIVYLEENLLKYFPDVKVTFFIPVGKRAGVIKKPSIKYIAQSINADDESKEFFRGLYNNQRYEMAYHGTTHGKPGVKTEDFIHEWETFKNIDEAISVIEHGKEIYKDVFGEYPKGGKYGGYAANTFSEDSIDGTRFKWWCRYCNVGLYEYKNFNYGGNDENPITNFDIKFFGKNKIVDIPTTVDGSYINSVLNIHKLNLKNLTKKTIRKYLLKRKLRKIDFLLKNKLIISIYEHISPARVDGLRQGPNIYDDKKGLSLILSHLKNKNIWYCTCSELADYVIARESAQINVISSNSFIIKNLSKGEGKNNTLTLLIKDFKANAVILPDGREIEVVNDLVNIPLINGKYELVWGYNE